MPFGTFPKKAIRKTVAYASRLGEAICALPKRHLAPSVVRTLGPRFIRPAAADFSGRRNRPHVLILRNQFYAKSSNQPSTEKMHLDHTLGASEFATFDVLTYDQDLLVSPLSDLQLIAKCRDTRPNAVILSSWWMAPRHPSIASLQFIREKLGIPIAVIWWDTCSEDFWKAVQPYMRHFDTHVVMDNPSLQYADRGDPFFHRILQLWPPQDENLFCPGPSRDIPVSFLGQVSAYRSYRREVIDHLLKCQIPGYFSTQDRNRQVTHGAYAEFMKRSKISLNFSYSVSCDQLKSRVLEVMFSGALLLESENSQTSLLFTPMKDYVPFSSKEDLTDKIRHYLQNEHELRAIAKQGRETATINYNSNRFWKLLFDKLELIAS